MPAAYPCLPRPHSWDAFFDPTSTYAANAASLRSGSSSSPAKSQNL